MYIYMYIYLYIYIIIKKYIYVYVYVFYIYIYIQHRYICTNTLKARRASDACHERGHQILEWLVDLRLGFGVWGLRFGV